jgi:hypothetical protein
MLRRRRGDRLRTRRGAVAGVGHACTPVGRSVDANEWMNTRTFDVTGQRLFAPCRLGRSNGARSRSKQPRAERRELVLRRAGESPGHLREWAAGQPGHRGLLPAEFACLWSSNARMRADEAHGLFRPGWETSQQETARARDRDREDGA